MTHDPTHPCGSVQCATCYPLVECVGCGETLSLRRAVVSEAGPRHAFCAPEQTQPGGAS